MRYTYIKREFPRSNPIASALVIVAGAFIIALALILGFFAFLVLGAVVLVSAAAMGIRAWWLQRRSAGRPLRGAGPGRKDAIEGEFRVVDEERERP